MKKLLTFLFLIPFFFQSASAQIKILQEDFTSYTGTAGSVPAGWYFSYNGMYSTTGNYGSSGPNSYKFGTNNATIVTPAFSGADNLTFWLKGNTTDSASTFIIMQSADSMSWDTIAKLNQLPHTGSAFAFPLKLTTKRLKFTFVKSVGNVAFDDFLVSKIKKLPGIIQPAHIVIAVMENHSYEQIIGSADAPYINSLASSGALFTKFYALAHPSQPNYLNMYAGCNQGVNTDNIATNTPFNTPNLGASLINAGYSFTGYSEGLPSQGYTGTSSGNYLRRHAPWVNWQGTGTNNVPPASNEMFSNFPTDYNMLPRVSFVIPDVTNDMHNGSDPARITKGDTWLQNNLGSYINWANQNSSLFILTFDEDNDSSNNHIPTIITGQDVFIGQYSDSINHYNLLRTIEEMYDLTPACLSSVVNAISGCWNVLGVKNTAAASAPSISLFPNPASDKLSIVLKQISEKNTGHLALFDLSGRIVASSKEFKILQNGNTLEMDISNLKNGMYFPAFISSGKTLHFSEKLLISK